MIARLFLVFSMQAPISSQKRERVSSGVFTVRLIPAIVHPERGLASHSREESPNPTMAGYGSRAIAAPARQFLSVSRAYLRRYNVDTPEGKVLIVEDDVALRRTLRTTLGLLGFNVGEANTGEEALTHLRIMDYEAVILDINMHGVGGIETCRR